jgi:hypothetical protein
VKKFLLAVVAIAGLACSAEAGPVVAARQGLRVGVTPVPAGVELGAGRRPDDPLVRTGPTPGPTAGRPVPTHRPVLLRGPELPRWDLKWNLLAAVAAKPYGEDEAWFDWMWQEWLVCFILALVVIDGLLLWVLFG